MPWAPCEARKGNSQNLHESVTCKLRAGKGDTSKWSGHVVMLSCHFRGDKMLVNGNAKIILKVYNKRFYKGKATSLTNSKESKIEERGREHTGRIIRKRPDG